MLLGNFKLSLACGTKSLEIINGVINSAYPYLLLLPAKYVVFRPKVYLT